MSATVDVILYRRTTREEATEVLMSGFKDKCGYYLTDVETEGVFVSDRPLDENEGAFGEVVLSIELALTHDDLRPFEWREEAKPYREWQVPAGLLNAKGTVRVVEGLDDGSVPPYPSGLED